MKKQAFPVTNIGSVSLLMVFIVLCLVTFATLSLSSAASDYRFSQNIAEHNSCYYDASNSITLRLKEIDQVLQTAYKNNPSNYFQTAEAGLNELERLSTDFSHEEPAIIIQEATSDTRALVVALTLNKPEDQSNGFYRITSWKEVSTAEWKTDNNLNLVK